MVWDKTGFLLKQIDAKRSLPQSQKPKLRKLFVGGLAPETTEGTVLSHCEHALDCLADAAYSKATYAGVRICVPRNGVHKAALCS